MDHLKNLDTLYTTIISTIEKIHPSPYNLVWYFHTKHCNETNLTPKPFLERDSYERADQYNVLGVAVYFIHKLNSLFQTSSKGWNLPQTHLFTYELM